jgi:hypothetical protein
MVFTSTSARSSARVASTRASALQRDTWRALAQRRTTSRCITSSAVHSHTIRATSNRSPHCVSTDCLNCSDVLTSCHMHCIWPSTCHVHTCGELRLGSCMARVTLTNVLTASRARSSPPTAHVRDRARQRGFQLDRNFEVTACKERDFPADGNIAVGRAVRARRHTLAILNTFELLFAVPDLYTSLLCKCSTRSRCRHTHTRLSFSAARQSRATIRREAAHPQGAHTPSCTTITHHHAERGYPLANTLTALAPPFSS